jgi:outer membrane protein OmpA-like peptidoglycan-associated protein
MFNIAEMFTIDSPNKSLHVEVRLTKIDAGATLSLSDVRFNSGSAVLELGYQTDLVLLASWLSSNLTTSVEIIGHTDNIGSAPANLQLSEDRAEAVVNFLLTSGISADRLSSTGRGDQVPISTNATLEGKALNRRVEIVVN